mmetsp:Transcript_46284/g.92383  ORF Transcript_46284/g.92383 Transcript_46284/m.92383 type:complete len:295 (+) Transcript_46284:631-1515(+)
MVHSAATTTTTSAARQLCSCHCLPAPLRPWHYCCPSVTHKAPSSRRPHATSHRAIAIRQKGRVESLTRGGQSLSEQVVGEGPLAERVVGKHLLVDALTLSTFAIFTLARSTGLGAGAGRLSRWPAAGGRLDLVRLEALGLDLKPLGCREARGHLDVLERAARRCPWALAREAHRRARRRGERASLGGGAVRGVIKEGADRIVRRAFDVQVALAALVDRERCRVERCSLEVFRVEGARARIVAEDARGEARPVRRERVLAGVQVEKIVVVVLHGVEDNIRENARQPSSRRAQRLP